MLSRTASDLYWMSRYLERAENLARMLDVSYSLSLMPQDGRGDGLDELAMPLLITGTLDADTLQAVMAQIDHLRAGGRTVGIVSHVAELRDQIAERIAVRRVASGGSTLKVTA